MEHNDMKYLNKIDSPADLKRLSTEQLPELCAELREFIISSCAENPGHIGASLGTIELSVVLHYLYNTPNDKIVWDVGHQAYAHK
ncbi:MAG: 1-deoxy-D-xylulose-5-phosphate synthase N-terminal domain-containing protein, partial [Bacteroidales bacterium]|nr:1-deoxy-D-xylulose-5-phosphate synthase N-terminal domain-containing protein [Bacteroidales bacterium]